MAIEFLTTSLDHIIDLKRIPHFADEFMVNVVSMCWDSKIPLE